MNIYAIAICDMKGGDLPRANTVNWPRTDGEAETATNAMLGNANDLTVAKGETPESLSDLLAQNGGEMLRLWIVEAGKTPIPNRSENALWTRATAIPVQTDAPGVTKRDAERLADFLQHQCPSVFGWGNVEFA